MKININCKYFEGDIPCKFHKIDGRKCPCKDYTEINKRILIIKLGATGDIIRTTPLLRKIKEIYSNSEITWVANTPEILPSVVDFPLEFDTGSIIRLLADKFDILYNLDKDKKACALANLVKADAKKGFKLSKGKCFPMDKNAKHKWLTGLDDNLNRKNKKSYSEEIFEICGFKFNKEKYILDLPETSIKFPKFKKPIIGLNIGCGSRWKTRLWSEKNWIELAKKLKKEGYSAILLGGGQEDRMNKRIAKESGINYLGYFKLDGFINLINQCDLIVTTVTMALHVAIALNKKVVLFNNIFNKNEFELYNLGEIIEPNVNCLGCYKQQFDKECKMKNCMELITVNEVYNKTTKWLKK